MRYTRHPGARIQGRPVTGEAQSPAQRMRRYRARKRAAGFRLVTRYETPPRTRLTASELDQLIIQARAFGASLPGREKDRRRSCVVETSTAATRLLARQRRHFRAARKRGRVGGSAVAAVGGYRPIHYRPWSRGIRPAPHQSLRY